MEGDVPSDAEQGRNVNLLLVVRHEADCIDQQLNSAGNATEGSEPGSRRSIWETHFGETPHLDSYVLGPFGCLAFLILTKEQRQARDLCGHFGNRTIQGLYLGAHVDAASGVFRHLFTDGRTVYSTPHALKVVGDGYPLHQTESSSSLIPTIEESSAEQAGAHTFDRNMLAMVIEQARCRRSVKCNYT